MLDQPHPGPRADARLAPFAAAAVLAWLVVPVGSTMQWGSYAVSLVLLLGSGLIVAAGHRRAWGQGVGALAGATAFLAAVAVLRNSAGGISSGAGNLSLIPVFYVALAGTRRRELFVVLLAVAAIYLAPIVLIGAPAYPHSQYRAALLTLAVCSIIGLATQALVERVRRQAAEALRREQMLEQVGHTGRALFDSRHPRQDACRAPLALSDAQMAILLEPDEAGALVSTASAGVDAAGYSVPAGLDHPAHRVMAQGRPQLITRDAPRHIIDLDPGVGAGRPEVLLYQPLLKDGSVFAVLIAGWGAGLPVSGSRATVVALLAHEAALAISRADQLDMLADMAETDPLTGLANRRAWDARLSRATADRQPFTVAMFDLDHFKIFNDTHGHLAGDRLLRETAAAWREQLRSGDLLARLGGEEFGLLLFECDLAAATEVTDRLRELVTHGQTCSAGVARCELEEGPEAALFRADQALYRAKAAGRDRVLGAA